ncbi:single-stranded DNA-binding protein [Candidatus Kaiserbacteria bacterium RIFCSPHIGHO2_02_FULL_49_34]|uniref:Single-stranded DNA-binding protein n=1 Tax=Candidatus Kaiserbacteria bacterium RIFCSPHIGHO2_02_FULL_49_34 TaxID=1798491 RepID=A0A1F6DIH1_9BACT|nr:MAG: single-stranded DNA-binding protein [Candidatus Kaiserbacteria bacterium RIFCSPHIGHO2_02_FULL_49_34]
MYLNKVFLYGNLTRDPEMRAMPNGNNVVSFSLATNMVYKDREGNKKEKAEFHNIVVFGPQAESIAKWLKKGSGALVEGRLQTQSWEKDGQKHYRTEIVAENVKFGPKSGGSTGDAPRDAQGTTSSADTKPAAPSYPDEDISPEDIPF